MTATFAVQNSLYIISMTALQCVMGYPRGWGVHSPHPPGTLPITLAADTKKKTRYEMTTQFFIPMRPPTTTHNAKELHAYMKGGKPCAVLHDLSLIHI